MGTKLGSVISLREASPGPYAIKMPRGTSVASASALSHATARCAAPSPSTSARSKA
jgi:hypothetical protein